jgi:phage gp29-like protein
MLPTEGEIQARVNALRDDGLDFLRGAADSSYHRSMPGIGMPEVPTVSIAQSDQAKAASDEALFGAISANAGPFRDRYKMYPGNDLTPKSVGGILRQADTGIIYRWQELVLQILKRDARVASVHRGRRISVGGRHFRVRPHQMRDPRDQPIAQAMAHFVSECMDGLSGWKRSVAYLLLAPCAGLAAVEPIYRYRHVTFPFEGRNIAFDAIAGEDMRRVYGRHFALNNDNSSDEPDSIEHAAGQIPYKVVQIDGQTPLLNVGRGHIFLPRHKFIFHTAYDEGLIQERGWMRTAVWLSSLKQRVISLWVEFLNRFGVPNVRGQVPYNLWSDKRRAAMYQRFLQIFGDGLATLLPDDLKVTVDAYQAGGTSRDAFASFIGWVDTQLAILGQGEHLTIEIAGTGSYNAASEQANEKKAIIEDDDQALCETIRDQWFWSLVDLNKDDLSAVMSVHPQKLLAARPDAVFRLETRTSRKERLEEFKIAKNELGMDITERQVQDECLFDIPSAGDRLIQGAKIQVSPGSAIVPVGGPPVRNPGDAEAQQSDAAVKAATEP